MNYVVFKLSTTGKYITNIFEEKEFSALKNAGLLDNTTVYKTPLSTEELAQKDLFKLMDRAFLSEILLGNEPNIKKLSGPDIIYKDKLGI